MVQDFTQQQFSIYVREAIDSETADNSSEALGDPETPLVISLPEDPIGFRVQGFRVLGD